MQIERIKVGERIPHISRLPTVIPLKLFVERIRFLADNFSSRVTWKFRGGMKVQKNVGSARAVINAKQSDTIRSKNI